MTSRAQYHPFVGIVIAALMAIAGWLIFRSFEISSTVGWNTWVNDVHIACQAGSNEASVRSIPEPMIAAASSSFRFTVMGRVTVLDGDSLLISSGSDSIKVIVPGHFGLSTGQYAKATGSPVIIDGLPALVCSRDEVLRIQ